MIGKTTRSYFFSQDPFHKQYQLNHAMRSRGKSSSHCKTICIIRANNSKEISQSAQGVVSALMDCIEHFCIIPVVGNNNVTELAPLFYEVIYRYPKIDMIFSIGESSTRIAQQVTQEFGSKIPIFFILVGESTASYVMKRGSNVTGVVAAVRNYTEQFERFFYFTQYDRTKKILVPRSRFAHGLGAAYMDENGFGLLSLLASHKVEAELIDVTCREDLHTKIKPLLSEAGLVALPQDTTLDTYVDELIEMANERRIPLFSSNFDAAEKGAGISFGHSSHHFSKGLALLAKPIFVQNLHPSYLPAFKINTWIGSLVVNREAAAQQGLVLNMERVCTDENVILL